MLLSAAAPKVLTPFLSHSNPTSVSQPSGAANSCSRCWRHASTCCWYSEGAAAVADAACPIEGGGAHIKRGAKAKATGALKVFILNLTSRHCPGSNYYACTVIGGRLPAEMRLGFQGDEWDETCAARLSCHSYHIGCGGVRVARGQGREGDGAGCFASGCTEPVRTQSALPRRTCINPPASRCTVQEAKPNY